MLLWTQCFYKLKPKLKPKPKQKLHVGMTAVADAAVVIHHHHHHHKVQLSLLQLQFQFQFLPNQDVQLDNIELMELVYGTLLLYQNLFQIPVHQGSILTDTETVFHRQTQQPL